MPNLVEDPRLHDARHERAASAALKKLAYEKAFDAASAQLDIAQEAVSELPQIAKRLEALETRPTVVKLAEPTKTAKRKTTQKHLNGMQVVCASIAAELIRQHNGQTVLVSLNKLLPGDDLRAGRKAAEFLCKAATTPHSTTDPMGGADLVEHFVGEFFYELQKESAAAQLMTRAGTIAFNGASSLSVPRRDGSGQLAPAWVEENSTIPVAAAQLSATTFNRFKKGVISVVSNELLRRSNPAILGLIERFIRDDFARGLDVDIFDPTIDRVPNVHPASITFGAINTPSSGDTVEQILTDIRWLLSYLSSINASDGAIVMHENRLIGLQTLLNANSGFVFRDELAKGTLMGVPVIVSSFVDQNTVVAVDAGRFLSAADPIEIDTSSSATLVMTSADGVAPSMMQPGAVDGAGSLHVSDAAGTVPAAETRSMLQTDATALRAVMPISWGLVDDGTAYLTGVTW